MVDDDGPGVRPDALEKIFERFYTDRPHQGFGQNSGLGLSISKQIVEAHGGAIWVENRTGAPDADGDADRARRALRRAPAGDVMARIGNDGPCLGGAGRRARGADPRAVGRRQVAPGAGAHRSGAHRASCALPGWSPTTACISKPAGGRLLVRPAAALAGLIEVRGVGIRRLALRAARRGRPGGRSRGRRCRAAAGSRERNTTVIDGITLTAARRRSRATRPCRRCLRCSLAAVAEVLTWRLSRFPEHFGHPAPDLVGNW